ncbi:Alpha/Beta hydrolase protein [Schizothecium vesticola]|uniref:Alpha/Beta hydrolase protein n=1 Tax=Schizothecium vesticola TaxID=314040 RepID=A0AA40BQY8_9PEZI|nr:Alpha/Beta hydrolase protein [Schizothecium vesticola]
MHYLDFFANDGCPLAFQSSLPLPSRSPAPKTCLLLLHGFSGSSSYFTRNYPALTAATWVIAPDLRGHGRSGRPPHGYHVARLALDLDNLVTHLRRTFPDTKFIAVGCSIGAAVLWTHLELFGGDSKTSPFAGFVFVDQAPLQDRAERFGWGAGMAHRGCYDERTMLGAQEAWSERLEEAARGLVGECLGYRAGAREGDRVVLKEEEERDEVFFVGISKLCNGRWLARLIADHTRYDHREAIELVRVPVLVMAAERSGCFSVDGMMETARRAEKGEGMEGRVFSEVFDTGHWLFYEKSEEFNQRLLRFVDFVMAEGEAS